MINFRKVIKKLSLLYLSTENWYDFILFYLGFKNNIKVHLKNGAKIDFNKNDRKNLFLNPKFRTYKALASIYILRKKGIIIDKDSYFRIKTGSGKFINIPLDKNIWKFDTFLEYLYYLDDTPECDFSIDDISGDYLHINVMGNKFKILPHDLSAGSLYDIFEIFFDKQYSILDVENKVVIDIGSSMGDSTIYFLRQGAKKVIAFEPEKSAYELSKENLKLNNLMDKVEIFNDFATAHKLESIIRNLEDNIAVKIDCEGCEFDIITNLSLETLKKISQIILEYHYLPLKIILRLKKAGFKLKYFNLYIPWVGIMYFRK